MDWWPPSVSSFPQMSQPAVRRALQRVRRLIQNKKLRPKLRLDSHCFQAAARRSARSRSEPISSIFFASMLPALRESAVRHHLLRLPAQHHALQIRQLCFFQRRQHLREQIIQRVFLAHAKAGQRVTVDHVQAAEPLEARLIGSAAPLRAPTRCLSRRRKPRCSPAGADTKHGRPAWPTSVFSHSAKAPDSAFRPVARWRAVCGRLQSALPPRSAP